MKEKYFKNEYLEMWMEDGIVHAEYATNLIITYEIAKINVSARLEMSDNQTYPLFADVSKAKSMTKEARAYLSTPEAIRGISAGAFLIKTQIEALLVNAWLSLYKPSVPTKLFTEKDKAINWLEQFRRIN